MAVKTLEYYRELIADGKELVFYKSNLWEKKRLEILERDNYECQRCLGKLGTINKPRLTKANTVHHIVEVKEDSSHMLDDDNLISVCKQCHNIIHNRGTKINKKTFKKKITELW